MDTPGDLTPGARTPTDRGGAPGATDFLTTFQPEEIARSKKFLNPDRRSAVVWLRRGFLLARLDAGTAQTAPGAGSDRPLIADTVARITPCPLPRLEILTGESSRRRSEAAPDLGRDNPSWSRRRGTAPVLVGRPRDAARPRGRDDLLMRIT